MSLPFAPTDFPDVFQQSDRKSISAQKRYIDFTRLGLLLMIATAVLALLISLSNQHAAVITLWAVVIVGNIGLTIWLRHRNLERDWFIARALAESAKTQAWKYTTRAEPYNSPGARETFTRDLNNLLAQGAYGQKIGIREVAQPITPKMEEVRATDAQNRLRIYLHNRVEDQQQWYTGKSQYNQRRGQRWYLIIIAFQVLTAAAALWYLMDNANRKVNFTSLMSVCAASAYAWLQLKQFRSLGNAYALAASELTAIAGLAPNVTTEQQLSDFVKNAENAISREHSMWVSKRV